MELQKQPKTATKEQLRLAELLTQGQEVPHSNDDAASQKRVKKVVELTNCTSSAAEVALIDCEGSVEAAVAILLDKPEDLVLWSHQGKTRKSKSSVNATGKAFVPHARRGESQRANRFRREGVVVEQQQERKQPFHKQMRPNRGLSNRDQDGHSKRANSHEAFEQKGKGRGNTHQKLNGDGGKEKEENGTNDSDWKGADGWGDSSAGGTQGGTFGNESAATNQHDWKNGPRVFTASSQNAAPNNSSAPTTTSNWPTLDSSSVSNVDTSQEIQQKPKTFASVAATRKAPPAPVPVALPEQAKPQNSTKEEMQSAKPSNAEEATKNEQVDTNWSSWDSPPPAEPSEPKQQTEPSALANDSFGSSAHSLSVNREYTDHLKSAIGLVPPNKSVVGQTAPQAMAPVNNNQSVDYFQQQISHLQQSMAGGGEQQTDLDRKVEFATGDLPPPVTDATSYQFGFQFDATPKDVIPSTTSLADTWAKPHISSSIELDRSMLKNMSANVLGTMTNIPTTSSNVTAQAHFSTSAQHSQAQAHDYQRNASHAAALSFTDTASVNYPPANNAAGGLAGHAPSTLPLQSNISSTGQQQQQGRPLYTAPNPSMLANASQQQQHLQHLQQQQQQQQQSQALYQTSAAPTAVPQFTGYNVPYMGYNMPVATAPTLPGSEIDRLLMQQYGYSGLEMQLGVGAMSLGPPTTLAPSHRNPLDTFMENKYQQQQQQSVNQSGTGGMQMQHSQSSQQRGQSDTSAMFGGSSHVAPPPGFGMPTAPTQQSYMAQPPNLQSLFQMPAYPHHHTVQYPQHQFMMPNANRIPTSQRPAQTSPPEGNGHSQRRHDGRGPDSQGYGGTDSVEHSAGAGNGAQSFVNKYNTYRPYM